MILKDLSKDLTLYQQIEIIVNFVETVLNEIKIVNKRGYINNFDLENCLKYPITSTVF